VVGTQGPGHQSCGEAPGETRRGGHPGRPARPGLADPRSSGWADGLAGARTPRNAGRGPGRYAW